VAPSEGRADLAPAAPLPAPLASLVGRQDDIDAVRDLLLRESVRLVTLTGPGGVGKSRLALAVGAAVADAFPDGVRLVRLAAIADPDLVLSTIASSLGLRDPGIQTDLAALQVALYDREALLILDNFEQVIAAAADLADLLRACPRIKALVTSRSRLRVRGEHVTAVLPLAVPDNVEALDAPALLAYPAVELFVQRGTEIRPDFPRTADDVATVAAICRTLDGLPLAIELAAARLDILSPAALHERLHQRLPVLVGGARDLPDRLRTMRDAVAWSYDLLDADEQAFWRRLAVFAGGFTAEAAEAVAGRGLDLISSLCDKSLLRPRIEPEPGEPRYGMLETIREFGLEQLAASGEAVSIRRRHAAYFRDLAVRADTAPFAEAKVWLDRLEREEANLRAAIAWLLDVGEAEDVLRLIGAMAFFWFYRGRPREGHAVLAQALAATREMPAPDEVRAFALAQAGLLATVQGDTSAAATWLGEAVRLAPPGGAIAVLAQARLGGVLVSEGDYEGAAPLFAQTLVLARGLADRTWLAHAEFHLGAIAFARGDAAAARPLLRAAAEHYDAIGDHWDAVDPLRCLGLLACIEGDLSGAAAFFGENLTRLRAGGSRQALATSLADVATWAVAARRPREAARLFGTSEVLREREGTAFSLPARDHYDAARAAARATLGVAPFAEALAEGRSLTLEQALAMAEATLALEGAAGRLPAPGSIPAAESNPLTEREQEVLLLLAAGRTNPEIGDVLFIGRGTVRTHVSNILAKLGAKTRTEAALIARERGLL
jgi:non-specific serine/threonine protein kinase